MINPKLEHALAKAQELREAPLSNVYFIQCESFTKIGYTRDAVTRLSNYQVHNPFKVSLLASFNTRRPQADEDLLHAAFEAYHVRGEWFKLPEALLIWIKDNKKSLSAQTVVDKLVA